VAYIWLRELQLGVLQLQEVQLHGQGLVDQIARVLLPAQGQSP
jgi:hypothetical protein